MVPHVPPEQHVKKKKRRDIQKQLVFVTNRIEQVVAAQGRFQSCGERLNYAGNLYVAPPRRGEMLDEKPQIPILESTQVCTREIWPVHVAIK